MATEGKPQGNAAIEMHPLPDPPADTATDPSSPILIFEEDLPIPYERRVMIQARMLCRSIVARRVNTEYMRTITLLPITLGHANAVANMYGWSMETYLNEIRLISRNLQSVMLQWDCVAKQPCPYTGNDIEAMIELVAKMSELINSQGRSSISKEIAVYIIGTLLGVGAFIAIVVLMSHLFPANDSSQ